MKRALHIAIGTLLAVSIQAQETSKTEVTYDLTAETAVGTGDFTAYQLVSNRHHVLSTRANTGYVRGALNVRHPLGNDFLLSGESMRSHLYMPIIKLICSNALPTFNGKDFM